MFGVVPVLRVREEIVLFVIAGLIYIVYADSNCSDARFLEFVVQQIDSDVALCAGQNRHG